MCFQCPGGTVEERWIIYALMRDNVQHHLELGSPSGEFEELHRVEDVLGGQVVQLNALRLRAELCRAQVGLAARPISDLAVSAKTRAVVEGTWPVEREPSTILAADSVAALVPWLPSDVRTLDQVFGNLIRSLLGVTSGVGPHDLIEVHEG